MKYDYEVKHIRGERNTADFLLRYPTTQSMEANIDDIFAMDFALYDTTKRYLWNMMYPGGTDERQRRRIRKRAIQQIFLSNTDRISASTSLS
jgi:hypothetical protein